MSGWHPHAQTAPTGHWDEMREGLGTGETGSVGPAGLWARFIETLGRESPAGLNQRMARLRQQVHDNGIRYKLYAQTSQTPRSWALDLFPVLIGAADWQQIERGVRQRMTLLEHIMADAYGPQCLLRRGLLPAALVQGHPAYLYPMQGVQPVGGRYLSLAAFDLARGPDGLWWLLSQRTQAPSGLGYLLENRLIVSRLFPEAFNALPVQELAASYQALIEGLKARCPVGQGEAPHMALLTPGPYNETWFEQACLARYLGLTLVQAEDLTVRDDRLYLKTLEGLQRVHGLLKRVDDTWLDPLELRTDSALGVPGLLQAVRSGQLLVANTPGSGFLESSALLGFMPALARELLGEDLVLPAIPSWWCGEAAARPLALAQMTDGVIKPTYPSEGSRQGFEPRLGHPMDAHEREAWTARILREPESYTVQARLPLSHQPVWDDQAAPTAALQTRPLVLRVFALADAAGQWQVLPGGLARLGTPEGIASMQRGGSSADVWVQAPTRESVNPPSLLNNPASATQQPPVTPRAAENLFWMGRYSERTQYACRFTHLILSALGSEAPPRPKLLQGLTAMVQHHGLMPKGTPTAAQSPRVFERKLLHGLWHPEEARSVGYNLRALLRAAAAVRERLSPQQWHRLEEAEAGFFQALPALQGEPPHRLPAAADALRILQHTRQQLATLSAAPTDAMHHDDGWRMLSLGQQLERLDGLALALQLAIEARLLREPAGAEAVLQLFGSTTDLSVSELQSRTPQALVDLLVCNPDHPHSLTFLAQTLRAGLLPLGHLAGGGSQRLAALLTPSAAQPTTAAELWPVHESHPKPLLAQLAAYRKAVRQMAEGLSALFFTHSGSAPHSVSA